MKKLLIFFSLLFVAHNLISQSLESPTPFETVMQTIEHDGFIYATVKQKVGVVERLFFKKYDADGNVLDELDSTSSNLYSKAIKINSEGNLVFLLGFSNTDGSLLLETDKSLSVIAQGNYSNSQYFMEDIEQLSNGNYITVGGNTIYTISNDLTQILSQKEINPIAILI